MGQATSHDGDGEAFLASFDNHQGPRDVLSSGRQFKHPMAAMFHVLFKFLAFVIYLFSGILGQEFISTFVFVILLISMDFWVVKNVTGRLLVGLRWSNHIDDEGNSHWIFENKNASKLAASNDNAFSDQDETHGPQTSADSTIFWTGLVVAPMLWLLLMFTALFRFNIQWLMLVTLASILSLSNLYGYIRCRLGTSELKSSITQFVAKQVFLNYLIGGSTGNKPAT